VQRFVTVSAQGDEVQIVVVGPAVACGGHADFAWNHRLGISSHRAATLVSSAGHKVRNQAASAAAWVQLESRCFVGYFVEKSLPLFAKQKFEEP